MATHAEQHQTHPGPGEYVKIAAVLALITLIEVVVYYLPSLAGALTTILIVLSAFKFSMVVLWFMHLKFDSVLFSYLFVGGLLIAGAVLIALLFLFGASHTIVPSPA